MEGKPYKPERLLQPEDVAALVVHCLTMPPTGGMGMGIGRLAMVLTGASHLREVKLFPHLRPLDA